MAVPEIEIYTAAGYEPGAPLTLFQLNQRIRGVLEEGFRAPLWVVAEIARLGSSARIFFLDLVERSEMTDAVVAELRGKAFINAFSRVRERFETVTGQPLAPGMKVLLQGRVSFHERYGLEFTLQDIDPNYTLGDMERRRREVIAQLEQEGLTERNRGLAFPLLPLRIAVISSATAAGYDDFLNHLREHAGGGCFAWRLFAAAMQGDTAESSIAEAFARLGPVASAFDIVVLLRGGGSAVDLSCFDSYGVAASIARCPLPVVTGIGHQRDQSVADMVAHRSVKTPTAAGQLLVEALEAFLDRLDLAQQALRSGAEAALRVERERLRGAAALLAPNVRRYLAEGRERWRDAAGRFPPAVRSRLVAEDRRLERAARELEAGTLADLRRLHQQLGESAALLRVLPSPRLRAAAERLGRARRDLDRASIAGLQLRRRDLDRREELVRTLDPKNVLRRGYSITRAGGRVLRSAEGIQVGTPLETRLFDGSLASTVDAGEAGRGQETTQELRGGDRGAGDDRGGHPGGGNRRRRAGKLGAASHAADPVLPLPAGEY